MRTPLMLILVAASCGGQFSAADGPRAPERIETVHRVTCNGATGGFTVEQRFDSAVPASVARIATVTAIGASTSAPAPVLPFAMARVDGVEWMCVARGARASLRYLTAEAYARSVAGDIAALDEPSARRTATVIVDADGLRPETPAS